MADRPDNDVVTLVRNLIASGRTFSISLEHPDSHAVQNARARSRNFSPEQSDGDCISWIHVPGEGLVCVQHKDEGTSE